MMVFPVSLVLNEGLLTVCKDFADGVAVGLSSPTHSIAVVWVLCVEFPTLILGPADTRSFPRQHQFGLSHR